jgi:hypothetical protein
VDKCNGHKHAALVYKSPVKIWAGGKSPNTPIPIGSTVLDLVGGLRSPISGLDALESRIVRIDWPDMGIPAIDREGWQRIAKALVNLRKPIMVACLAGHGRTGTCLTILGCLLGQIPRKMDPVLWVRDHYCANAVESKSQIDYIEEMTQRSTAAKPSHATSYSWTGGGKPANNSVQVTSRYPLVSDAGPSAREIGESSPARTGGETFRHFGGTKDLSRVSRETREGRPIDEDDPGLDPTSPLNRR